MLNIKSILLIVTPVIALSLIQQSCKHDPVNIFDADTLCFEEDVLPLLQNTCATTDCHNSTSAEGDFIATDYSSILKFVEPGYPEKSLLYKSLTSGKGDLMPPHPEEPLTYQQRTLIRIWIQQGAKEDGCAPIIEINDTIQEPTDTIQEPTDTIKEPVDTIKEPVDTTPVIVCGEGEISFQNDIWPIINKNCVGCHNATRSRGGINLDSYSNVANVANTMEGSTSLLVGVTSRLPGFKGMPQGGSLSNCNKKEIEAWVEQGAKNN